RVAIVHMGRIVAMGTPAALLADLGREIVEVRIDGDAEGALALLRERGVAGEDAVAVGSSVTVPRHDRPAGDRIAGLQGLAQGPLLTRVLFAVVTAPAVATIVAASASGSGYMTFVAIGTIGLLVPISCMFAGIGVLVDRESGARRDLLAAPIPRSLVVFGNLA